MVLDAIEGDLATKNDLALLQEKLDGRMSQFEGRIETRVAQFDSRLTQFEERNERRFVEMEFRIVTRLGLLMVSTTSIAVAILTWLIKI